MGGSTQCFSIEDGGATSEAQSRHPTCRNRNDAASETRHPLLRNGDAAVLTWQKRAGKGRELLANWWHGVSDERLVHVGLRLDVGGDHYGMLS